MSNEKIELANIVASYLNDHAKKINLKPANVKILQKILSYYPQFFNKIEENINNIIKDNTLDVNDIPYIVLIVKDIINLDVKFKDVKEFRITKQDAIQFIESTLFILIDTNVIKSENPEKIKTLINLTIQVLESSIDMVDIVDIVNIKKCNYWCC